MSSYLPGLKYFLKPNSGGAFMVARRNGSGNSGAVQSILCKMRKRPRAKKWECEFLETRRLFATVSWITNGSGNWSVGANWNTGVAPAPGDNVVINVPGLNVVVTYDNPATLVMHNIVNDELLVLASAGGATWTSGTFDGSGIIDSTTTMSISGSADKILKDGITFQNDGTTTVMGTGNIVGQVGATIYNYGTFDSQSDMKITFPTGIGDGNFNNMPGGTFLKSIGGTAPGDMTEIGGAQGFTFNNDGDCQILQGTLGLGDNVNASLSVALAPTLSATFEISAGATLQYLRGTENLIYHATGTSPPYYFPSITGAGTLLMTGGNVQHYGIFDVDTIDMESGSLLFQQNMTALAGTPQLIGGLSALTALGYPVSCPAGDVNNLFMNGGTFGGNGGGIFNYGGLTSFNTPPGFVPAGLVATSSGMPQFSLGPPPIRTYELPAMIVNNTFSWTGGTISGTGRMVIDTAATSLTAATITTTNPKTLAGGFGLDLLPEVVWTGSGTIGITGNSTLWIHASATFWDQNNGTISGQGSTGNLLNSGNFLKENGTGTTLVDTGITFYNNSADVSIATATNPEILYPIAGPILVAQLDIQTGIVAFNGNSINTDDYTIDPGGTLSFLSGVHINGTTNNLNVTAKILGTNFQGTVNFGDNVFFTGDTRARLDVGTTNFGAGTYDFNNLAGGAQVVHVGSFTGGGTGTIGGNGTIEVADSFQWNSGTFVGTGGGTSSLLVDTGAVLTMAAGNYATTNNYAVDNRGTMQWAISPGTLNVNGNFDQTSTGIFNCGIVGASTDSLTVSGTVTLAGAFNLTVSNLTPFAGETFTVINNLGLAGIAGIYAGFPEGTVFSVGGDTFQISYLGGTGNDLVLTSIVLPTVTIVTPGVFLRALSSTTFMNFTVVLSAPTATVVTVHYTTVPGTAVAGVDYTTTSGTLTIAAGQTSGKISVPIIGSAAVQTAVTFSVVLSNPTNSNLGAPSTATGTIISPNGPPALSFSPTAYIVDESAGFATVIVTSSNSRIPCSVHYTTVDGTAIAGVDYVATTGVLSFAVGVFQLTFNVPIIDRGLTQGQTVFTIVLSNPSGSGATLGAAMAAVAILDDDGVKPTISIDNPTVTEFVFGQTKEVFTLTLSAVSATPVTVQYATADGTAVQGKYVPESGTVTLQPGQTTAQITVPINSDFVQNSTETFSVNLSNPTNVTLATPTGIGTILSQTLTTLTISKGHSFRYLDAFGKHTTISLSGPGIGTITYLGPTTDDGKQIVLDGTTTASQLSFRTDGGPSGAAVIIVNGSIKAINASSLSLLGDLTVSGAVQTLRLSSLMGGNTVSIGAGAGIGSLNAKFKNVINASFTSAIPLAALRVSSWANTTGGAGITAPSAKLISSSHDFDANISLTGDLGSLSVHGMLNGSIISAGGNINSVTAGSISNSDIFAGVLAGVITLPANASQFADTTSTIKRLTVTSRKPGVFANTLIAAPVIGNVQLGRITVSNNGTPFGIVGTTIRSVRGIGTAAIKLTNAALLASAFSDNDLIIHL